MSNHANWLRKALITTMLALPLAAQAQTLEVSAEQELLWDQSQGLYQAIGDAIATRGSQTIRGDTLRAYYSQAGENQDIERLEALTNVSFSDTNLKGSGSRLDYNIQRNFYEITGPNAVVTSQDGTAKAEQLIQFDRAEGRVTLEGRGEITLTDGRRLKGDQIYIALNEAEEIETIFATGNVFISQPDGRQAEASEGTYDAKAGTALLTGDVKIIDGESILNGQKAEIDFNSGVSRLLTTEGSGRVSGILVE